MSLKLADHRMRTEAAKLAQRRAQETSVQVFRSSSIPNAKILEKLVKGISVHLPLDSAKRNGNNRACLRRNRELVLYLRLEMTKYESGRFSSSGKAAPSVLTGLSWMKRAGQTRVQIRGAAGGSRPAPMEPRPERE